MALAAVALSSTPAFASKARLSSLGQDVNGSLYIDDTRNIFLNPAQLARMGDFANFEWGATNNPGASPNAEGGYFATAGSLKYGLQLGRRGQAFDQMNEVGLPAGVTLRPNNTFELVFAGSGDLRWGASLLYGASEDKFAGPPETKATANTFELRGGVETDQWQAFAGLLLMAKSEFNDGNGNTNKYEGKPSVRAGGSYNLDTDQRVVATLDWRNAEVATGPAKQEHSDMGLNAQYVRFVGADAASRFFYAGGLGYSTSTIKQSGGPDVKDDRLFIPLTLGLEESLNDWVVLRAAVTQNVLIDQIKETSVTDNAPANTTRVAAGAGFKWKKLTVDTTFEGTNAVNGAAGGSGSGRLNTTELLANVGMTYLF